VGFARPERSACKVHRAVPAADLIGGGLQSTLVDLHPPPAVRHFFFCVLLHRTPGHLKAA